MWGSEYTNCSGRTLVEALDVHDLVVLNATTSTHFLLSGHNAWSLSDSVLVSSSYASLCTYTVTSEFLGSDHSVVLTAVKANTMPEDQGVPKWNFSKADWRKFTAACDQTLSSFFIHCTMQTAYLKPVFARLLWKLFLNPRAISKSLFRGGISSATWLSKTKNMPSTKWIELGFYIILSFSNGAELKLEGLYSRQNRPPGNNLANR